MTANIITFLWLVVFMFYNVFFCSHTCCFLSRCVVFTFQLLSHCMQCRTVYCSGAWKDPPFGLWMILISILGWDYQGAKACTFWNAQYFGSTNVFLLDLKSDIFHRFWDCANLGKLCHIANTGNMPIFKWAQFIVCLFTNIIVNR